MNGSSNPNKTYREYLLAHINDLVRFWRSKVKVIAGHRDGERRGVEIPSSGVKFKA